MLFLRMGARLLFIRTNMITEVKNFFMNILEGREVDFIPGMAEATEDSSLIFITDTHPVKTEVKDAKEILIVNAPASICLSTMINSHISHLVERVDMGPSFIVMRIAGNKKMIEEQMLEMYGGKTLPLEEAINEGEKEDTILVLTHQQLSGALTGEEFLYNLLVLPHPASQIFKKLRSEGILFITRSLEHRKWYELRINIYDSQGRYKEHYERLILVINKLEIGMILEEGWTRDHALTLFTVLAYQVRLFTFYAPDEMKRILLGLEYNEEGKRWVDFDLYYRNKKVSWGDIDKKKGKRNKIQECLQHRTIILEKLTQESREKLFEIENKISK